MPEFKICINIKTSFKDQERERKEKREEREVMSPWVGRTGGQLLQESRRCHKGQL